MKAKLDPLMTAKSIMFFKHFHDNQEQKPNLKKEAIFPISSMKRLQV